MTSFETHSVDTAPEKSKPLLAGAQKAYGFVPNLLGNLAEAPAALRSYMELSKLFGTSNLSASERQTILLTASFENRCHYCMAAHSTIAGMEKVPADVIEALRENSPLADEKLEALRTFTRLVVQQRGFVDETAVDAFLAAGYTRATILEVITGVALKTISNYTNHIAETPVDQAFAPQVWTHPADR